MEDKYILDANVFMQPSRSFYPFDFAASFWRQMEQALLQKNVF